jgi:hypothetical protein
VQDGRAEWSYVEHGPLLSNFCRLPVAVVFSGAPLTPPSVWSVVHQRMCLPRIFAHLLTAADHGCGDATTSGRTCPLVVFVCSRDDLLAPSELSAGSRRPYGCRQGGFLPAKRESPDLLRWLWSDERVVDRRYRSRLYPFHGPGALPHKKPISHYEQGVL